VVERGAYMKQAEIGRNGNRGDFGFQEGLLLLRLLRRGGLPSSPGID
jgi:hypothetical protein